MKRKSRKLVAVMSGCILIILSSWFAYSKTADQEYPINPALVFSNNAFGFEVFQEVVKTSEDKNVFISPSSIALALAMTYNGAEGATKEAMADTLHVRGLDLEAMNSGNAGLIASLENADPKVQISIANSIWSVMTLKPEFAQRTQGFYDAEFGPLDINTINAWVKRETKGRIPKIADSIAGETMILINAVYFKGNWSREFKKAQTRDGEFTLADGTKKTIPLMHQDGEHEYFQGKDFRALRLPYGSGRLSMYIFLPNEDSSLKAFQSSLNLESWEEWMSGFRKTELGVAVPRFKMEYETELNDALKALGMEIAFMPNADFTGMCEGGPGWIDQVKHKTFVEVNEEGTEAAAVTSVHMIKSAPLTRSMIVNRPFLCVIRDDKTGAILFMGSIMDPKD